MNEDVFELDDLRRQDARFRSVEWTHRRHGHITVIMTCAGREALFERTWKSLELDLMYRMYSMKDLERAGQAATFFRALELAAEQPDFERVTILEDDLVGARRALLYAAHTVYDDDVAMHSWFHQLSPNPPQQGAKWMIDRAANHSCNQAITMPASTVHALLDSVRRTPWTEPHGADMLIGQVMPDAKVAYHFPNLVDHVGGDSSLVGNTGARRSSTFPGEHFDAYDLTRQASSGDPTGR